MKKLFITLIVLCAVFFVNAQKNEPNIRKYDTTLIVLDPLNCCGAKAIPDYIREDTRLSIKIKNVNPLAAKIGVSSTSDTVDFDVPDVFNLSFGDSKEGTTTAVAPDSVSRFGFITEKANIKKSKSQVDTSGLKKANETMAECIKQFHLSLDSLKILLNLEARIKKLISIPIISKEELTSKIALEIKCLGGDTACCWYSKKYNELIAGINLSYNCIKNQYASIQSMLNMPTGKQSFTVDGTLKDVTEKIKVTIKNGKIEITGEEDDENTVAFKKLETFMNNFLSDSSSTAMMAKITAMIEMCIDLKTSGPFELCKSPLTVTGDVFSISPVILGNNGKDTVFSFPTIPLKTYGGFRLNFSTGLSFAFFGENEDYFKEKSPTDSFIIRKGKIHDDFMPSITAFMHAYWRAKHRITPAITVGLSINPINLETTRFYVGGSAIFGQNRRLIFSAGFTGGQVDILAKRFDVDKKYANEDFTGLEDKDFIEKKFKMGAFFGFSYNLSAKR